MASCGGVAVSRLEQYAEAVPPPASTSVSAPSAVIAVPKSISTMPSATTPAVPTLGAVPSGRKFFQ